MDEDITMRDAQTHTTQPPTPPLNEDVPMTNALGVCGEAVPPSIILDQVKLHVQSTYKEWSGVARQLVVQPADSRNMELQHQVIAVLDEVICAVGDVLETPDIDEGSFPLVVILLCVQHLSYLDRFLLTKSPEDFNHFVYTHSIVSHFCKPSELGSDLKEVSETLERLRPTEIRDVEVLQVMGVGGGHASNSLIATLAKWAFQTSSHTKLAYGSRCDEIRLLIGERYNRPSLNASEAKLSFPEFMTLIDSIGTAQAIVLRQDLLEQAVESAIGPLVIMNQDSMQLQLPNVSFGLYSDALAELLARLSTEIETIQSEDIDVSELIVCTVDLILELPGIGEDHYGIIIALLFQSIDALLARCRILRDTGSLDRANHMIGRVSHFCGISDINPGLICGVPERFRSAQELGILLSHSSDQPQDIEDLMRIAGLIHARRSQLTAIELIIAVVPIVSAFAVFSINIPQQRANCCTQILKCCNEYIPAIENPTILSCLRDYGTCSAMYLSTASVQSDPLVCDQVLTFIDICFQGGLEDWEFCCARAPGSGSPSPEDDQKIEWKSLALEILHAQLRITAVAGDMRRFDTILEYIQKDAALPYASYGMYGSRLEHVSEAEGSLKLRVFLMSFIDREWSSIWNRNAFSKFITALRYQFYSEHGDVTQNHRCILALLLAVALYLGELPSDDAYRRVHPKREAYPYFAYFLAHWDLDIPAWASPFCQALYEVVKDHSSMRIISGGSILAKVRILEKWDSRFKRNDSSEFKGYLNQSRREVATRMFTESNTPSGSSESPKLSATYKSGSPVGVLQMLLGLYNKITTESDLTHCIQASAFRGYGTMEEINNLIPLDMTPDQWDASDHATEAAVQHWAGGCIELFRLSQADLTDSERIRLCLVLGYLSNLAGIQSRSPYDRARTVQYWQLLSSFSLNARTERIGDLTLRTIREHSHANFHRMWEIGWSALEEINWTASSVWESIADRQLWQLYLEEIFLYTAETNQSTPEFHIEGTERFNGTIWTHLQQLRTPLNHLAELRPELASRLQVLQDSLERQWVHTNDDEWLGLPAEFHEKSNADLLGEWTKTLDEIRRIPGFERFFRGKSLCDLTQASRDGPIVLIQPRPPLPHPDSESGVAFIIYCDKSNPKSEPVVVRVSLPLFTMGKIEDLHHSLTAHAKTRTCADTAPQDIHFDSGSSCNLELDSSQEEPDSSRLDIKSRKNSTPPDPMVSILAELWDIVANPVIDTIMQLQEGGGKGKSSSRAWQDHRPSRSARGRIWWCCLGQTSFLPIHAAGIYLDKHIEICVSDFFISSYTPSLGALADARNRPLPEPLGLKILAAAQPTPGGGKSSLPSTKKELEEIAAIVPEENLAYLGGQDKLDLTGEHTTVHNVLEMLPEVSILHLACHGQQDVNNPVKSGFILRGGERLTLQDLIKLRVPKAYMAILSACHTASNDAMQPEEVMNMTRTAMFLGFRTIVGTKWPMADADGPIVAKAVYSALFAALNSESGQNVDDDAMVVNGVDPLMTRNPLESFCLARVVDDIVHGLQERGISPKRWATFVHIGI
ncbi:hypothetical protein NLI96_g5100 [Meripilus lineatus]|uniref:CHAT domain-containing protein n=1 Tax=Meripilus lineatus TaxID=2056292 RepID=A0AAD5V5C8_9APHY|nr:hypothetical protein NLI96_g5100 [Physisporinus lineatus]